MFPSFSSDSKVTFIFQQYSFDINSFISSCLIPSTFKTQNNCFLFPLPYISSLHHSASKVCSVCTTSPLLIISNAHFDKSNSIFISGEKTLTICTKLSSCSSFLAMIFRLFMIKRWLIFHPLLPFQFFLKSESVVSWTLQIKVVTKYQSEIYHVSFLHFQVFDCLPQGLCSYSSYFYPIIPEHFLLILTTSLISLSNYAGPCCMLDSN